jgi:flagellar basal body-associated protein FliL
VSENLSSSESAVEENVSSEPIEPVQPEQTAPPKGDKKKLWVVVIAIIVVAALIGSVAYVLVISKNLEVKLSMAEIPDVPAGDIVPLSVEVKWGGEIVTGADGVKYWWEFSPTTVGKVEPQAKADVVFTAGKIAGEGTIECEVTYKGKTKTVEAAITVDPPFLETVNILPVEKRLDPDEVGSFTATTVDSVGDVIANAEVDYEWSVSGGDVGEYTLSATTGPIVNFSASVEKVYTLTVEAARGTETASTTAIANVTWDVPPRTIDYNWYGMFEHPLGPWYEDRYINYGDEWAVTDSVPYIYIWDDVKLENNSWIYTHVRLNATGRNMPELNMNENPEFLPFFGSARGGNAEINWYMDYPTRPECIDKLGPMDYGYYDGWYVTLNGTITLDKQAAKAVLGATSGDLETADAFDDWWSLNQGPVKQAWEGWMTLEGGNDRLAIFNMYEYPVELHYFVLEAEMVGDEIVLDMENIGWGTEALMTRWMHEAWMPTEWYMEDMYFNARIGPEMADIDLDTAVAYAAYAYEATDADAPCWAWEALMQDYVVSSVENPISLFDAYADFTYDNFGPGNGWYGMEMPYDYTPGVWNLSEGETLTFEWPDFEVPFFIHDNTSMDSLIPRTIMIEANMTITYAEPDPVDAPDCATIDTENNTITYVGPFNMYNWSRDQTVHDLLAEEWAIMDMPPWGAPYIEMRPDTGPEPTLDLVLRDIRSPLEVGEESRFNVTIVDEITRDPYPFYTGTITFSSSDPAAVLPDDYTFVSGDAGSHEFTVTFNTVDAGMHQSMHFVTAVDEVLDISGSQSAILVVESPVIGSFGVEAASGDVIAGEPVDVTVTAYNQWDEVFTAYDGTVNFTSDDADADLPPNTPFTTGTGVQVFSVTFSDEGTWELNVSDLADPEAYGVVSVDVLAARIIDHFVLSGVDDPTNYVSDPDQTMTVTAYDQYGDEFDGYDGTVDFESNESVGIVLPPSTAFTLGVSSIDVDLTFSAVDFYTIWCNDSDDSSITGSLEVQTTDVDVVLFDFEVTGVEDMWENNYSDITVRAIDNFDGTFEDYVGTITFSTNAPVGSETLPEDYTFLPADNGVHTFPLGVSFDEPGTFTVTVEDAVAMVSGSSDPFEIIDLYADSLEFTAGPSSVTENETFGVTVTCYHQFDEVFVEYDGTVTFETSDESSYYVLPADHEFDPAVDAGERAFDDLVLSELGAQTVTVTDIDDGALTDTLDVEVMRLITSSITYRIYDMFEEPWGPWNQVRVDSSTWDTERLLTADPGEVTYLYSLAQNPTGKDDEGQIYAPYRWNIVAESIPNVDVHAPEFMPTQGVEIPGAEVSMDLYWQYVHDIEEGWWTEYWVPEWSDHPAWQDWIAADTDGYFMATIYNITMNREAAEEWMGMPQGATPATWWAANEAVYVPWWQAWIDYEANDRLDIFCGYEWPYNDWATMMRLTGDADEVELQIAHMSAGFDTLTTRWLLESEISVHQTYMEDFQLIVDFSEDSSDLTMDAVCQWNMHAVKANASAPGDNAPCAWVWEPIGMDYIISSGSHDSQYDDYAPLAYQSWNCGDPAYSLETRTYEYTPWAFSLPEYGQLIIELPTGTDIIGYYAEPVPATAISDAWDQDAYWDEPVVSAVYDGLRYYGEMDLGYAMLGDAVWDYDDVGKVLTVNGPYVFENPNPDEAGLLYHGAPWIEFDVTPVTQAVSASSVMPSVGLEASSPVPEASNPATVTSATTELVSLASMISAVMLTITALAVGARRRDML